MKINPDFTIQQVGASFVAVPVGEASKTFHAMLHLNETGAFLWKQMAEKDCTEEDLVAALLAEYEVDADVAKRDVGALVAQMRDAGLFL